MGLLSIFMGGNGFECTFSISLNYRYSLFQVLYPLGVTGELLTMFAAMPEVCQGSVGLSFSTYFT